MASRYPATHVLDYCFSPRTIWRDGEKFVVPCGKCDGCLLHKANVWSMRVGNEIDSSPYTIFATFTYSPRYLPTLKRVPSKNGFVWTSRHSHNIRFNGVQDVLRLDKIDIPSANDNQLVRIPQNGKEGTISYASKSDFQLYMKMLRKCLKLKFQNSDEDYNIRYFTISEYGPTHLRHHLHSLFFVRSYKVAEFMLQSALYENWQMCDKDLFQQYTRYADNGTRNYVTNYVTGFSKLPEFLRQKEIRPFRLSSKGFAIGFDSFDETKVQESIFDGTLQYSKSVPRLESKFVFQYPKGYLTSLFPKCYRYSKRDFGRLLEVYGALYTAASRSRGFLPGRDGRKIYPLGLDSARLRKTLHSQDWQATKKCYEFCSRYLVPPFVYVSLLVDVYYKLDMSNLKRWYLMQQQFYDSDPCHVIGSYSNVFEFVDFALNVKDNNIQDEKSRRIVNTVVAFLDGFGIDFWSLSHADLKKLLVSDERKDQYITEVEDIIQDCVKLPKFNEEYGCAPHII